MLMLRFMLEIEFNLVPVGRAFIPVLDCYQKLVIPAGLGY